jgi:thiamine-phosphate pyrophosphorylase
MLLYAITGRRMLPGGELERQAALVSLASEWARGGVDYIQVREKDLAERDLLVLAQRIVATVREEGSETRVLVNGPAKLALEAGADGVHLPGSAPYGAANDAREVYLRAARHAIVSRACHSIEEARTADASLIVFAPVFEKADGPAGDAVPGQGLGALSAACRAAVPVPVIALGGVTLENAAECVDAGAAGVAGIRLFLGEEWRNLHKARRL